VCMTIGFMTRPALIVTTILAWYEWQLAVHLFPTSYHRLVLFTLIILCFSNSDRTYSLRMKLTQGSFCAWEPISIFPQRLIALQLTAIYLGAALQKFWLPGWQGGEILSYMLIGNWATPLAYWIARLPLTIAVFDASVWIVKFFLFVLPFGLWIPKLRTASFIGGALFHLCITLLLGPWGFLVMIPLYACFVPGDLRSVQAPQLSK